MREPNSTGLRPRSAGSSQLYPFIGSPNFCLLEPKSSFSQVIRHGGVHLRSQQLGSRGRKITCTQKFEAPLGNKARPCLKNK